MRWPFKVEQSSSREFGGFRQRAARAITYQAPSAIKLLLDNRDSAQHGDVIEPGLSARLRTGVEFTFTAKDRHITLTHGEGFVLCLARSVQCHIRAA